MRTEKKSLEQLIKSYNDGHILYRFQINGNVRIGQSVRGFNRLAAHFRNSYYYSRKTGEAKSSESLPIFLSDLRKESWKNLNVSYISSSDFGLGDRYNAFWKYFRPIVGGKELCQDTTIDRHNIYKLDIAELLYTYYEADACSKYSIQCGSQHNIAEIAFEKGKAVIGNRILEVQSTGGTTPKEAQIILDKPISNYTKIMHDLNKNLQINLTSSTDVITKVWFDGIKKGLEGKQSPSTFKKNIEEALNPELSKQLNIFKKNLKATGIFQTCSNPIDNWTISYKIKWNDSALNKIISLKDYFLKAKTLKQLINKIYDLEGSVGAITIQYSLDRKTIEAIKIMDKELLNTWQTAQSFQGEQVPQDFRKKLVALRFIDIWYNIRNQVGSQMVWSDSIFHTRPSRMKNSKREGMHELPEYAFVFNANPDIRKSKMHEEFSKMNTYIPGDWDMYYHILMSIADNENSLEYVRRVPLSKRQPGITRPQYSIYIYEDLPSWVNSQLPSDSELPVHWAYAVGGEDEWIKDWLQDKVNLDDLVDY